MMNDNPVYDEVKAQGETPLYSQTIASKLGADDVEKTYTSEDVRQAVKVALSSTYGKYAETDSVADKIPGGIRTAAYIAVFADAILSAFIVGAVTIFWPEAAENTLKLVTLVSSAIGTFAGICGIMYRPTR